MANDILAPRIIRLPDLITDQGHRRVRSILRRQQTTAQRLYLQELQQLRFDFRALERLRVFAIADRGSHVSPRMQRLEARRFFPESLQMECIVANTSRSRIQLLA